MELENLSEGERFIVGWQYDLLDGFNAALATLIFKADIVNLPKIAKGFPVEVKAYRDFTTKHGWWDRVKKRGNITQ